MKLPRWNWKQLGLPGPVRVRDANGKQLEPLRIYRIWRRMLWRSGAVARKSWAKWRDKQYYAHVTVCDEWRHFPNFYRWAMTHGYREDLTIDRIDWRRGYSPDNCRWATCSEQMKNRHLTDRFWESARRNLAKAQRACTKETRLRNLAKANEALRRKRLGV